MKRPPIFDVLEIFFRSILFFDKVKKIEKFQSGGIVPGPGERVLDPEKQKELFGKHFVNGEVFKNGLEFTIETGQLDGPIPDHVIEIINAEIDISIHEKGDSKIPERRFLK